MADTSMPPPEPLVPPAKQGAVSGTDLRTFVLICYGLYLLGVVSGGLTTLIGVIIAYVKREDARGTAWASHFDNLIVVFWVSVLVGVVAALTMLFLIGFVFAFVLAIWYLYRTIRGLIRAVEHRPFRP
jgi:uncharacterized membrane protein